MNRNSKIIIYDDNCPLCSAYTNAFIQTGLIDKDGRKNFSTIKPELIALVDIKRSVNEIPLIDTNTRQVWYGIDALLEILGQKIPFIKTFGNIKLIKWFLFKLYKLISFNRRVIVANRSPANSFDCTPDFNLRYRIAFLLLVMVFTRWLLFSIQQYLPVAGLLKASSFQQMTWLPAALVLINISIALLPGKKDGLEYLGQAGMLILLTCLVTIPIITINKYLQLNNSTIGNIYLAIVTIFIMAEYIRRMKFIKIIPQYPLIIFVNGISLVAFVLYLLL